jgi:hypothetical protein
MNGEVPQTFLESSLKKIEKTQEAYLSLDEYQTLMELIQQRTKFLNTKKDSKAIRRYLREIIKDVNETESLLINFFSKYKKMNFEDEEIEKLKKRFEELGN